MAEIVVNGVKLECTKHKRYKVKRYPMFGCQTCRFLFHLTHPKYVKWGDAAENLQITPVEQPSVEKRDLWLLWQISTRDGRAYLLAVDESEEVVNRHRRAVTLDLDGDLKPEVRVYIEHRQSNHLYGAHGL